MIKMELSAYFRVLSEKNFAKIQENFSKCTFMYQTLTIQKRLLLQFQCHIYKNKCVCFSSFTAFIIAQCAPEKIPIFLLSHLNFFLYLDIYDFKIPILAGLLTPETFFYFFRYEFHGIFLAFFGPKNCFIEKISFPSQLNLVSF